MVERSLGAASEARSIYPYLAVNMFGKRNHMRTKLVKRVVLAAVVVVASTSMTGTALANVCYRSIHAHTPVGTICLL